MVTVPRIVSPQSFGREARIDSGTQTRVCVGGSLVRMSEGAFRPAARGRCRGFLALSFQGRCRGPDLGACWGPAGDGARGFSRGVQGLFAGHFVFRLVRGGWPGRRSAERLKAGARDPFWGGLTTRRRALLSRMSPPGWLAAAVALPPVRMRWISRPPRNCLIHAREQPMDQKKTEPFVSAETADAGGHAARRAARRGHGGVHGGGQRLPRPQGRDDHRRDLHHGRHRHGGDQGARAGRSSRRTAPARSARSAATSRRGRSSPCRPSSSPASGGRSSPPAHYLASTVILVAGGSSASCSSPSRAASWSNNPELPFPESVAAAEIHKAGQKGQGGLGLPARGHGARGRLRPAGRVQGPRRQVAGALSASARGRCSCAARR